ncbi:lysophospholipid acyltransferase family protein [Alkalimarinus coralli]|uniref:lysophospholipid acyltransferase family protein n=1 Tax=Alkalimarinus coralli TaxID=2935863 RepID=UPI00202B874C|nr:lysophospholipid acyltransferase family protein [Alkalimarinus coralli]
MVTIALTLVDKIKQDQRTTLRAYYRLADVFCHCSKLSVTLPTRHLINTLRREQDNHLLENRSFKKWLGKLIEKLNVEVIVEGQPEITSGLYVSNHISWLDAVVLANISNFSFIAKNEVKRWPLIGPFGQMARTVFIERKNKFSVYRSLPKLEEHLNKGRALMLFPEGTTTNGTSALPFFPMLYEAAVRSQKPVQAVTIRYTDHDNRFMPEVGFIEEDNLFDTLIRMLKRNIVKAHICFHPPIENRSLCRKKLAHQSHKMIVDRLSLLPI